MRRKTDERRTGKHAARVATTPFEQQVNAEAEAEKVTRLAGNLEEVSEKAPPARCLAFKLCAASTIGANLKVS